ncbi:MAG: flagellar motor protein MotB, partial [Candidatus Brocadiales bacterium]
RNCFGFPCEGVFGGFSKEKRMPIKYSSSAILAASIIVFAGIFFSGCAGQRKALEEELAQSGETVQELQRQNSELQARLAEKDAEAAEEIARLQDSRQMLESALQGTGIAVRTRGSELVISLPTVKFFGSGQYKLKRKARRPLSKVAKVINSNFPSAMIRVEGHTDNRPIKKLKEKFESNWELSAARAASVLHYFIDKGRIDPKRIYLAGFGEYHPITSNATAAGRQKNRRVEIVVLTGEAIGGI